MTEHSTRMDGPITPDISLIAAQIQAYQFCVTNRRFKIDKKPYLTHSMTVKARCEVDGTTTDGYYVIHVESDRPDNSSDKSGLYEHHVFASKLGPKHNQNNCLNLTFENVLSREQ